MDVKINVAGGNKAASEVGRRNSSTELSSGASGDLDYLTLLDEQQRMLDILIWGQQSLSGKSQHRNVLINVF